jgi:Zn-dependent peptidase ImmA (M78 family)
MIFSLAKISSVISGFNLRRQTENDFFEICDREKIKIVFDEMPVLQGFICKFKGQNYIFLDRNLRDLEFLYIAFHELAHYFLHEPNNKTAVRFYGLSRPHKDEDEADATALLCLFPESGLSEFQPHSRYETSLYRQRLAVYERFSV